MSGHRQNGHFSVFFRVFQKRALGNVKVEVLWQNLSGTLIRYSDQNKDGLVTI